MLYWQVSLSTGLACCFRSYNREKWLFQMYEHAILQIEIISVFVAKQLLSTVACESLQETHYLYLNPYRSHGISLTT